MMSEPIIEQPKQPKHSKPKEDEDTELRRLKYKTQAVGGSFSTVIETNQESMNKFLENDKTANSDKTWPNMDRAERTRKLIAFTTKYCEQNGLDQTAHDNMMQFFRECLDRKRLNKVKDVVYDKTTHEIKNIPALTYNKSTNHFTLKHVEKPAPNVGTQRARQTVAANVRPGIKTGTIKNVADTNRTRTSEDSATDC